MPDAWITTSSTNVEAIVNPLNAACNRGFVPDDVYILENPGVTDEVDQALAMIETIVEAYDEPAPEVHLTALEADTAFERIHEYIREAIEESQNKDSEVAVDITPGRKFMSAIAFATGMQYGADHVYYLYLDSSDHYGKLYPEMPRPAVQLYDFVEELR